ncbi:MAG: ArsR/SmtB family transcription factor [Nitrospiraceae bacterium]
MRAARNANVLTPRQCALILKALGDETRLRILESLLVGEKCVTDLVQEIDCSQPHASHHLRILRDSGLVEGHRCGKQVCYRVTPEIQRALAKGQGQALDFGCCELRFPESALMTIRRTR